MKACIGGKQADAVIVRMASGMAEDKLSFSFVEGYFPPPCTVAKTYSIDLVRNDVSLFSFDARKAPPTAIDENKSREHVDDLLVWHACIWFQGLGMRYFFFFFTDEV